MLFKKCNNWLLKKKRKKMKIKNCFSLDMYITECKLCFRGISEFRIHSYLLTISMIIKLAKIAYCRRQMLGLRIVVFLINLWVLFTAILMRPHNVILFGSLIITSQELQRLLKLESNILMKTVISHHWLAHIYFFYQVSGLYLMIIF